MWKIDGFWLGMHYRRQGRYMIPYIALLANKGVEMDVMPCGLELIPDSFMLFQ